MVRQAHTYLVGAMSGATLIAIAIAVFVVLVSAQVFRDWPIAALGGGNETARVSTGHPAAGTATSAAGGSNVITASAGTTRAVPGGGGGGGSSSGSVAGSDGVAAPGAGQVTTTEPHGSATGTGGQGGGSSAAAPQNPSTSSSSGTTGSSGSSGGSAGSGRGGATGGSGSTRSPTPTPAAQVTETVNGTVAQVDETALGGTLHETGVTGVTESVVNGVAGPESTLGKVVDETAGVVGGLLRGNR